MKTTDAISLISKIREKANKRIVNEMEANGIGSIVTSHGDILYALFANKQMTMAEIAEKIGKDKSTVTALIDKLVKLEYVTKERNSQDTRVIFVSLTSKGIQLQPIFESISTKILDVFFLGISNKEQVELIQILSKIYKNL
ncbi:MAG: MarR family winged helix-turn-helix transcriptional regulator [Velocimicrobium sp.]